MCFSWSFSFAFQDNTLLVRLSQTFDSWIIWVWWMNTLVLNEKKRDREKRERQSELWSHYSYWIVDSFNVSFIRWRHYSLLTLHTDSFGERLHSCLDLYSFVLCQFICILNVFPKALPTDDQQCLVVVGNKFLPKSWRSWFKVLDREVMILPLMATLCCLSRCIDSVVKRYKLGYRSVVPWNL